MNVLEAARALASIKKDLIWNKIMVDWIERQKPVIAASYATSIQDIEGNNNQGLTKNARSQSHSESSLLLHYGSPKLSGPGEPQLARSVLGSSHESEASKPLATKRTQWPQMDSIILPRRSKRRASLKEKRQARDKENLRLHPQPPPPSDRAGSSSFKVITTTKKTPTKSTNRKVRNKGKDGANSERRAKVQLRRRSTRVSVFREC